ncbi:hypothetical protein ACFUAC_26280 [Streptomyces sp. NPDC057148]|uniref:hypothetical protein n=1 Tax=unclassified Streptomyces TaxID=2593676 RepID=UPI003644720E
MEDEERLSAAVRAVTDRSLTDASTARPLVALPPPPEPVAGCEPCAELADLRAHARTVGDGSAETDADVPLARHQRRDHGERSAPGPN